LDELKLNLTVAKRSQIVDDFLVSTKEKVRNEVEKEASGKDIKRNSL
jgi:hypothetical protein